MCRKSPPNNMMRLLIFLWLPLWIGLPFIHIHPGIGHAHVSSDHDHTPVFHSIFHADLPDIEEMHDHPPQHTTEKLVSSIHPEWEHTHQELVHPELQFSTLHPSSERKVPHWNQLHTLSSSTTQTPSLPFDAMLSWHTVMPPPTLLTPSQSPRGPPLS